MTWIRLRQFISTRTFDGANWAGGLKPIRVRKEKKGKKKPINGITFES